MCRNCPKKTNPKNNPRGRKLGSSGPGEPVKLKYLGGSEEPVAFEGAATRREYVVGGRINLVEVDSRDLATGISWAPGLLELTGKGGAKLFRVHVPLKEEVEAEARAKAMAEEAWEAAEALALPPEGEPKPKRRKAKTEKSDEDSVPGD